MRGFRQRLVTAAINLSILVSRRHKRADDTTPSAEQPPRPRMNDRLRDRFRRRWLKYRK